MFAPILVILMASPEIFSQVSSPPVNSTSYPVDDLIADLESIKASIRDKALTYLLDMSTSRKCGSLGDKKKEIVARLEILLEKSRDVDEQKSSLLILGGMHPEAASAIPVIIRFLPPNCKDDRLTILAQYALRDMGSRALEAIPILLDSFSHTTMANITQYRRAIPCTLVEIAPDDAKVRRTLRLGLGDKDQVVCVCSAWALWRTGSRDPRLIEVWSHAMTHRDAAVREETACLTAPLIHDSMDIFPIIKSALNDPNEDVRRRTVIVLSDGRGSHDAIIDVLVEKLSDTDEWVQIFATEALAKLKGKAAKAVPVLKKKIHDRDVKVKVYSAKALFAVDPSTGPDVVDALIEGLMNPDPFLRIPAVKGLVELGSTARPALSALRRALGDTWPEVREKAAEAIKSIEASGSIR